MDADEQAPKKKSSTVLNGLSIAALVFFVSTLVYALAPGVEKNIQSEADAIVAEKNIQGWSVIADGRDIVVSELPGASVQYDALRRDLSDIPGVRVVRMSNRSEDQSWMTSRQFLFSEFNFDGESFSLMGTRPFEKSITIDFAPFDDRSLPSLQPVDYWSSLHQSVIENSSTLGGFRLVSKPEQFALYVSASMIDSVQRVEAFVPLLKRGTLSVSALGPDFPVMAPMRSDAASNAPSGASNSDGNAPSPANGVPLVNEVDALGTDSERVKACQQKIDQAKGQRPINFDSGASRLNESGVAVLMDISKALAQCDQVKLLIIGHTDNSGPEDVNRQLSDNRANSVREELIKTGINSTKLSAEGKGSAQPLVSNDTPEGRAKNRRIEFKVRASGGE